MTDELNNIIINKTTILKRGLLYFLPTAIITVAVMGLFCRQELQTQTSLIKRTWQNDIELHNVAITREMRWLVQDLNWLKHKADSIGVFESDSSQALQSLAPKYIDIGVSRGIFDQIRILDVAGQEILRINFAGNTSEIIAADQLQDKSSRYYYKNTIH